MSNRILVVTQQGEARFLTTETTPTRVITIQPTGARGETGPGVPTGGSTNDILKKTSSTNYDTAWETPTSAATANAVVRRDASGGAAFDDLTAATVATTGAITTSANNSFISTYGDSAGISTNGDGSSIQTNGTTSHIQTRNTFKLYDGVFTSVLSHSPTNERAIVLPNASGNLALCASTVGAIASADITDATSAATANMIVRRDASGGAAFDDLTAATVVTTSEIYTTGASATIRTDGNLAHIFTVGTDSYIYTQGANADISTSGATAKIKTTGSGAHIQTQHASASVRSYNFAAYDATAGAALRDSAGTAYLTWGATAGNISITVDTISTGHFLSNPSTATAGHFLTKNGTAPTIAAGRSAWFSSSTGDPQFRNGTSSAVTLVYSGGALGTPSSGTLTNCTGLPVSTGISGLGTGVATFLATPSSANLLAALTTSTGTGSAVFATSPTITTPTFTRTGNGTIITASESSRTITMGTASYGVELVLTTATGTQGAYGTFSGMLEAFVAVNASSNTSGQRWMRFGNKSNRFAIQRLTDGGAGLTATPFSFANDAPESAFYMLTSGTVGFGTSTPSEKALLDLTSTTKGFLPPRMSTGQRDAITSVPAGLMVYNTTTNKLNFYNGSAWEAVTSA